MSLKIYSVYINPKSDNPIESAVFVKEGFSFLAGLFHFIWALYNKLFIESAVIFAVFVLLVTCDSLNIVSQEVLMVFRLTMFLYIGFSANDWIERSYRRKGYTLYEITTGTNEIDAQRRFFDLKSV